MMTPDQARDKVQQLVERARRAGADGADALCVGDSMNNVSVRMGELEDVSRSEGEKFGLRVFVGQRSASVASSDLSGEAMDALVTRADGREVALRHRAVTEAGDLRKDEPHPVGLLAAGCQLGDR